MFGHRAFLLLLFLAACSPQALTTPSAPPLASEAQISAAEQTPLTGVDLEWNAPVAPFTVIGNIHYVGVEGVSAFLITTPT
jgi:metallo-beta-lactamase class B